MSSRWGMQWAGVAAMVMTLAACRGPAPQQTTYQAEIRRTSFGVPHIKAKDDAGLGYGLGYAYAQDNFCMFSQMVLTVNGERSRYFGPDAVDGPDVESGSITSSNLESDFIFKLINSPQRVEQAWRQQKPEVQARLQGYAAGMNRFLADTGAARLPVECRSAPWVRDVSPQDLIKIMRRLTVEVGVLRYMKAIVAAQPPGAGGNPGSQASSSDLPSLEERVYALGSNAAAFGKDATENGRGLLFGNPHYPWLGSLRFYQLHLTIPGQLDVMGVTLAGFPVVAIGFNENFAWTHTVNTSRHSTVYALPLDERDPTKYQVDGATRAMTRETVTVDVKGAGDALTQRSHDFWMSSYGPILSLQGELEWSAKTAYALRDANFDNNRMLEAWFTMNQAHSLTELESAITTVVGIPWVNTLAADAQGQTLFASVSVVPNLPETKQRACQVASHEKLASKGLLVLNAGAACDWDVDPAAPQPGIFAGKAQPILKRSDFVHNANDSAWMTNPAVPLTGFAPVVSEQDYEQDDRTRIGLSQIQARLAGTDGLPGNRFNVKNIQSIAFNNRSYYGTLWHADLLQICANATPVEVEGRRVDVREACETFRGWDQHANVSSTGYALAQAWIARLSRTPDIWRVPFDAKDPINTPRGIKHEDKNVAKVVREALARSVIEMQEKQIDARRPWGEIQGFERNGKRVPIPGGRYVYNAMVSEEANGQANIRFGSSYVQLVTFDGQGPQATAVLAYSQSTDPTSPHYADQAARFTALDWIAQPFTDRQIETDPNYQTESISQ